MIRVSHACLGFLMHVQGLGLDNSLGFSNARLGFSNACSGFRAGQQFRVFSSFGPRVWDNMLRV